VDDAELVRDGHSRTNLLAVVDNDVGCHRALAGEHHAQRFSLDELHDDERVAVGRLAEMQHLRDVPARNPRSGLRLAFEAGTTVGADVVAVEAGQRQHLERDGAVEPCVNGAIHHAVASAPELLFDAVPADDASALHRDDSIAFDDLKSRCLRDRKCRPADVPP
jgi:hypothetical protein